MKPTLPAPMIAIFSLLIHSPSRIRHRELAGCADALRQFPSEPGSPAVLAGSRWVKFISRPVRSMPRYMISVTHARQQRKIVLRWVILCSQALASSRAGDEDGFPAARPASAAHHADHAPATRSATTQSYDWNGRRRGQTPFTVLQHTIAGGGNLLYERRRYRLQAGRHDAGHRPAQSSLLAGGRRALGILLDFDERPGGGAHPSHHPGRRPGRCCACESETIERIADCCLRLIEGEGRDARAPPRQSPMRRPCALYDDVFGSQSALSKPDDDNPSAPRRRAHVLANLDKPLTGQPTSRRSPVSAARISRACSRRAEGVPPGRVRARRAHAPRGAASDQPRALAGQGDRQPDRLRRAELFRQGLPPLLRHQPDRVPDDRDVLDHNRIVPG